ncbi:ATPase (AAA+ superfamily) [Nostoc linckia z18]|uniref:ATPase (AAA+ superfamily) n=2 Tax=Nostoc linckia TaxID=92942 RepID=A0A9Q6EHG9_NOSLI|nr:ATP-binding protein [Nostoc linckia]PHK27273.1 ATPase (AAA+ superfamily) [Nostoc linckia z15]PHK37965.1 ATPase (AAA+ superfamily) [Nostoc linckia z16]PHJ56333.1 ATPase (AAA+ superfamily) [Nostoc linckia z2]PHJ69427.1 ATPase (AAA+ superfamily) [Nostoc linckia z3]PHJ70365.1 ATPase (AAA+ superfamily) [Nostoc linckia z4]
MNNQAMPMASSSSNTKIQYLQRQAASLLLYQSVLQGEVGIAFLELLQAIRYTDADARGCLQAYGYYFHALAASNQNWEDYIINQILFCDNPFTKLAQQQKFEDLSPALLAAVGHDLQVLQSLYECSSAYLSEWVQNVAHLPISPVVWYEEPKKLGRETKFAAYLQELDNWGDAVEELAAYYRQYGSGLFAQYRAFRWQAGEFIGIPYPDPIKLSALVGYESQRDALLKNTEFLLSGELALHVLLYGSRGSGKSSLVKSLLHEYSDASGKGKAQHPLCLLEVAKSDLKDLPEIVEHLREVPQKFIVFVDDLSFEEDDDAFKALKVVLEGNLTARPQNVVVYATSNRRHLIREFFVDRPAPKDNDEIHAWDTMQEKLSFSDRFGLTLTFEPANQKTYLNIVRHLAAQAEINITQEDLEYQALQWATRHNGRSGRTARQFIDFLKADLKLFHGANENTSIAENAN